LSEVSDAQKLEDTFPGLSDIDREQASEGLLNLLTQVERDVEAWRPEPGDSVYGIFRDVDDSSEGDYGSYPILIIESPSGRLISVHAFHTVLRRNVERKMSRGILKIGDEIAIQYRGAASEGKGGKNPAEMYRVAVRRP
jgi:hypothetical protein